MSEIYFENQGTNTYLVYQLGETDELDTLGLGMLTNNSIPGFAAASFTQMDMDKFIKYNVSAKVSVKQLFSGPVNKKRLLGVFSGVVDAMISSEEYMLDPNSVLLDTDYIFADVTTCETELVCLPVLNQQQANHDLAMFFKNILFTTQFDQTENCDHVAQLINYLNTNPVLILEDFKALLNKIANNNASQPAPQVSPAPPVEEKPAQTVVQPKVQPVATPASNPTPTPTPAAVKPQVQQVVVKKETPVANVPPAAQTQTKAATTEDEKPMSWLYLMQHYNKENAAIYKAQQDAKKTKGSAAAAPQPVKPAAQKATPPANTGFAVPGQTETPVQPAAAKAVAPIRTANTPQKVAPQTAVPVQPVQPAQPVQTVQQPVSSTPLNFGETTVLSAGMGETTVLGVSAEPNKNDPHLIRTKNNEKIPLNKPVFRIGKERSYVDYFISDNTAISRGHANIVDHNGEFFVVDTNSTNHTYLNGAMIQSGIENKLSHGDKIRLANEDFEFKMY